MMHSCLVKFSVGHAKCRNHRQDPASASDQWKTLVLSPISLALIILTSAKQPSANGTCDFAGVTAKM
jgi:hypothetical protein